MERENIRDYDTCRQDMQKLRECITAYMSMALGGSGIAIIGMGILGNENPDHLAYSFMAPFLSVINSLILAIMFYKFTSHNRYAGYCKLLNQERFEWNPGARPVDNFAAWEFSVNRLRSQEASPAPQDFPDPNEENEIGLTRGELEQELVKIMGPDPPSDRDGTTKGFKLIGETLRGEERIHSWIFPMYITIVFLVLTILYLIIGLYFAVHVQLSLYALGEKIVSGAALLIVIALQTVLWRRYAKWLHRIMMGSSTVGAYCWKFLPIRYRLVKGTAGQDISYRIIR